MYGPDSSKLTINFKSPSRHPPKHTSRGFEENPGHSTPPLVLKAYGFDPCTRSTNTGMFWTAINIEHLDKGVSEQQLNYAERVT
jgi:hypothetical protein